MSKISWQRVKFIVDAMLGDVAKWLRVLGYDTFYCQSIDDAAVLKIAASEKRVIVTKDKELSTKAKKMGLKCILLRGENLEEKLLQIARETGLELYINLNYTRCPKCNSRLVPVPSIETVERVPPLVSRLQSTIWLCPNCGSAYWTGSHYNSMNKILKSIREKLTEVNK